MNKIKNRKTIEKINEIQIEFFEKNQYFVRNVIKHFHNS